MNTPTRVFLYAKIDVASGTGEIVAAQAGTRIIVMNYTVTVASTVTLTWKSASTALSGAMTVTVGLSPLASESLMATASGEALNLTLGSAVQVSGHLTYCLESP